MALMLPNPRSPLKIGTRGSPLALAQAREARERLMAAFELPDEAFEIVAISTAGDRVQDRSLSEIGGKGLFTGDIENALLAGEIDIAVHSMKDMPTLQPDGLMLDCYLPREDPRDAFVSYDATGLGDLAQGAVVGTSSLRRRAQVLNRRRDLTVVEFRGNVQTRLAKLRDGVAKATFLAMAGLNRLGLEDAPRSAISPDDMLPAIAQGTIGIEARAADYRAAEMLEAIHNAATWVCVSAERKFLQVLDGSCQTPIAGLAELDGSALRLRGEILRSDGSEALVDDVTGAPEDGGEMARVMAEKLLQRAGDGFFDWR